MFPKFVDVPAEDLEANEDYRRHALQVVEAVGLAIGMLDDAAALEEVLENLGSAHCNHKVEDPHFDVRSTPHAHTHT